MLFGLNNSLLRLDPAAQQAAITAAKDRLQTTMENDPSVTTLQPGGVAVLPEGMKAQQQPQTAAAFQWGQGGARLTADQITQRTKIAQQRMAAGMDYSPVGSWTQGLARVAQALVGGQELHQLDKATAANAAEGRAALASFATPDGKPSVASLISAASNPYVDENVQGIAKLQLQAANRPPPAPHYWQTNNGSEMMVGPDGKPQVIYADPTPKINWVRADNGDGTFTMVPMGADGSTLGGGAGAAAGAAAPLAPVGKLTPIGGPTRAASATFP